MEEVDRGFPAAAGSDESFTGAEGGGCAVF
jgi:hypothetical protein